MYDDSFYENPTVLTIEIQPDDVLSVNINGEVGWMVSDELRNVLIKGCIEASGGGFPEFDESLQRTIETLQSFQTREDFEREELED